MRIEYTWIIPRNFSTEKSWHFLYYLLIYPKEDMLSMMSEMTLAEIAADLQLFIDLREDGICEKIRFVMDVKGASEMLKII